MADVHRLTRKPPTPMKLYPQVRCRTCYRKGVRTVTRNICAACPGWPGLCSPTCFREYHEYQAWHNRRAEFIRNNVPQPGLGARGQGQSHRPLPDAHWRNLSKETGQ